MGRGPRLLGPFRHSTVLAGKVFKEASWGSTWVVVVGEQTAGSPTLSMAPAWAGTLQGEEWDRERTSCVPKPSTASLSLSPWAEAPGDPKNPSQASSAVREALRPGRGTVLTCSFSSCSPKVEMPPVEVLRGVLGRRHTLFSRSQDTLGFRVTE